MVSQNKDFRTNQGGFLKISSNVKIKHEDNIIFGDASRQALVNALPSAAGWGGKEIFIKKIDSSTNQITIMAKSGETIDGKTSITLIKQYDYVKLCSDGANWIILAGYRQNKIIILTTTSDFTINSETTPQDVPKLVQVLKPNTKYYVVVIGRAISPAIADLDATFKAIPGTSYAQCLMGVGINTFTNFGTAVIRAMTGLQQSIFFPGWLKTGPAGGTLQFQINQDISDAGNTSIFEGTSLFIYELD